MEIECFLSMLRPMKRGLEVHIKANAYKKEQVEPGVSWPKVMTVTITLNSSFDYQAVENVLSSLPPQIRWNSDIKEI